MPGIHGFSSPQAATQAADASVFLVVDPAKIRLRTLLAENRTSDKLLPTKPFRDAFVELRAVFMDRSDSLLQKLQRLDTLLPVLERQVGTAALGKLLKDIGFPKLIRFAGPLLFVANDINANRKPALAPTLSWAANMLLDRHASWDATDLRMYARVSNDIFNRAEIRNGNCGAISARNVVNSLVPVDDRVWAPVACGVLSDASRALVLPYKERAIFSAPLQDRTGRPTARLDAFMQAVDAAASTGRIVRASIHGCPPLDAAKPVKRVDDGKVLIAKHSINFLRLKTGELAMLDSQSGQSLVGRSAIRNYLAAYAKSTHASSVLALPGE